MPELDPNIKLVEQFTMFTYDIWHYNIQCLSSLISAWLLVPNSIVSVAHKDDHMYIEVNNLSVLSSWHQQQMVISCLILGKYLILKYTTINATIAAYWGKLQLSTPDSYNKEHVTVILVSTATIQKLEALNRFFNSRNVGIEVWKTAVRRILYRL